MNHIWGAIGGGAGDTLESKSGDLEYIYMTASNVEVDQKTIQWMTINFEMISVSSTFLIFGNDLTHFEMPRGTGYRNVY